MRSIRDEIGQLLVGGDKTGENRWYETNVPLAEKIFDRHLERLKKEK